MSYDRKKGYTCDVCGDAWEEATYFIFIKQQGKKFHTCDPVEQSKWKNTATCLTEFIKRGETRELSDERMIIRRVFGISRDD